MDKTTVATTVTYASEGHAQRNENGTFTVEGYPTAFIFIGEYNNYEEREYEKEIFLEAFAEGYVCHMTFDPPNKFVLVLSGGESKYIVID